MDSLAGSGLESAFPHCRGGPAKVSAQAIENHRGRVRMRWVRVSHSGNMRQAALEIDDHVPTMRATQGKQDPQSPRMPMSAPKYAKTLSGKMLEPAPPKTIRDDDAARQTATTCFKLPSKKCGDCMFWSSMFLTETPITSGANCFIAFRTSFSQSASKPRANNRT